MKSSPPRRSVTTGPLGHFDQAPQRHRLPDADRRARSSALPQFAVSPAWGRRSEGGEKAHRRWNRRPLSGASLEIVWVWRLLPAAKGRVLRARDRGRGRHRGRSEDAALGRWAAVDGLSHRPARIQRAVSGRTAGGLRAVEVTNFADFDGDSKGVEMVGLGRRREGVRIRETNSPGYSVRMAYGQACGEPRSFRQFGRQFGRRGDLAWEAARWR